MSSTAKVKRYWPTEIKKLVRSLQEAQETHSQIVKGVRAKFCARFDQDYNVWLQSVKIVAQLDCLISLSKASVALGEPRCRPTFVEAENERSVLNFEELRHPCMLPTIGEFIPNDVKLGGDSPKITLLTGANAAGKSTVLRMVSVPTLTHYNRAVKVNCITVCGNSPVLPLSWHKSDAMSPLPRHSSLQ